MTEHEKQYLIRLRALCETLTDNFEYELFYAVCKRFMSYKQGTSPTKNITKKEVLETLISKNLLSYRVNKASNELELPDDRMVRKVMRELLKKGFPIISTSHEGGYFIAEEPTELDKPQKENYSRAVAILAVDKGYNRARTFILGGAE